MKKIIALILTGLVTLSGCGPQASTEAKNEEQTSLTIIETEDTIWLQNLINENNQKKEAAHQMAENARILGFGENHSIIQIAKSEWSKADQYVIAYTEQYNKAMEKEQNKIWEQKKQEYPYATEIWLYMKNLGWNDYVCAGIMGNLMAEVGGQTLNIQYWLGDGTGYYGMCQWSTRYCPEVYGTNLSTQCEYLKNTIAREFNNYGGNYYKGFNYNAFLNLHNERDAAVAFAKCYERCASFSYGVRQTNATKAYNYFVN